MSVKISVLLLLLWCCATVPLAAQSASPAPAVVKSPYKGFPPRPPEADGLTFYQHRAAPNTYKHILEVQQECSKHDVDLAVVVIDNSAEFGLTPEEFTSRLVSEWKLNSHALVFLVCQVSQMARIQLGSDWNPAWGEYADEIMVTKITASYLGNPVFEGVDALGEMATHAGQSSTPWTFRWGRSYRQAMSRLGSQGILPTALVLPFLCVALVLGLWGLAARNNWTMGCTGTMVMLVMVPRIGLGVVGLGMLGIFILGLVRSTKQSGGGFLGFMLSGGDSSSDGPGTSSPSSADDSGPSSYSGYCSGGDSSYSGDGSTGSW